MKRAFSPRVAGALVALLLAILTSRAAAQVGYAWADQPSAAEYQPSPLYSYSSTGGRITISRTGIGAYSVRFTGLGATGDGGGHVQVTSYGDNSDMCKLARWDYRAPDFVVEVRCFSANGDAADSRYTIVAGWLGERRPLPSGSGADSADPVRRLILEDGAVEFRYLDGTTRRYRRVYGRSCTIMIVPGAAPDSTCGGVHSEVPYNLPPLSDANPRGLPRWIQDQSNQLMRNIEVLLHGDPSSIENYKSAEAKLDLYKRVERRLALVTKLLEGR